jgi:predicted nucleic acid-binding protein
MSWVLDASVAIRWFLEDEFDENAERVLNRLVHEPGLFAVPELFCFETFSVLQRLHPAPLKAFVEGVVPILQGGAVAISDDRVAGSTGRCLCEQGPHGTRCLLR